ncbi:hypothetical protein Tco_0549272, partial [Tanacetum coccineum]
HEKSSSLYAELGLSGSDTESDEEMPSVAGPNPDDVAESQPLLTPLSSLQHLTKDFSYGDQFIDDKPSEANNEKTIADTKAESMVSVTIQQDTFVIPPMISPVIDPVPRPDSPNVHWPLPTTTTTTAATTTTTPPLPPQPQQGSSDSIFIKRMGELEQHIADLVEENQALEKRLDKWYGYQENEKNKDKTGQNRAREWKEREKTSPTVPSLFIGPARNPLYGPGQPILEPAHNFALVQQVQTRPNNRPKVKGKWIRNKPISIFLATD